MVFKGCPALLGGSKSWEGAQAGHREACRIEIYFSCPYLWSATKALLKRCQKTNEDSALVK